MKQLQRTIKNVVLSVAGFDPSAGAGICSDVKVFERFGLKGLAVPTVLTVQNDSEFKKMQKVDDTLFEETMSHIFNSYKICGLKIGLIANKYHVDILAEHIKKYKPTFIVLDPIISSSSGFRFWDSEMLDHVVKVLFPLVDVLTPNYIEAVTIFGQMDQKGLAQHINKMFRTKVAITGGDSAKDNKITDVFCDGKDIKVREADHIDAPRSIKHGTGCRFSSVLLSNLCNGFDFIDACFNAARFVEDKILEDLK